MVKHNPLPLSELRVPAQDKMATVMKALSDKGRADFLSELYEAIAESAARDDHAPVQYVLDAWWVSGKFVLHPQFDAAYEAAGNSLATDPRHDAASLTELLTPA